jgi:hypothetical protein
MRSIASLTMTAILVRSHIKPQIDARMTAQRVQEEDEEMKLVREQRRLVVLRTCMDHLKTRPWDESIRCPSQQDFFVVDIVQQAISAPAEDDLDLFAKLNLGDLMDTWYSTATDTYGILGDAERSVRSTYGRACLHFQRVPVFAGT